MYLKPSRQMGIWALIGLVAFMWLILTVLLRKPIEEGTHGRLVSAPLQQLVEPQWQSPFGESWRGYLRIDQYDVAQTITTPGGNRRYRNDYVLLSPRGNSADASKTSADQAVDVWVSQYRKARAVRLDRKLADGEIYGIASRFSAASLETQKQMNKAAEQEGLSKFRANDLIVEFESGTPFLNHWSFYVSLSLLAFSGFGMLMTVGGLTDEQEKSAQKWTAKLESVSSIEPSQFPAASRLLLDSDENFHQQSQTATKRKLANVDLPWTPIPSRGKNFFINVGLNYAIGVSVYSVLYLLIDYSGMLAETGMTSSLSNFFVFFLTFGMISGLRYEFLPESKSIILQKHPEVSLSLNDESFEQQYLVRQLQAFGFSLEGKWTLGTSAQNMCPHLFFLSSNANVLVADGLHGRSIYSATTDGKLIETANDYFVKWRRQKNYPKVVWQYSGKRPISEALELHAEMVEQYLAEHNLQQIAFTEENLKALLSRKYKSSV